MYDERLPEMRRNAFAECQILRFVRFADVVGNRNSAAAPAG
jgi:hypothetical protein